MKKIENLAELQKLYGEPASASMIKEVSTIIPAYQKFIEASPFCTLATIGDERDDAMMDCSPRGDVAGFVKILDEQTLAMPDRHGNNRIDSLRNIITDPRVALCFLVPGSNTSLRINGEAFLTADQKLLSNFTKNEKAPRSVIVIKVRSVYFQCGRAILRSGLWDQASMVDPKELPSAGDVLSYLSENEIDGGKYDAEWGERAKKTLW